MKTQPSPTVGWSTWTIVLIVVLLIVLAVMVYLG